MKQSPRMLLLLAAVLFAAPAGAQVEQLVLRVDGLACPFCAYGVEKKLEALDGSRLLQVRINEGKILLGWRADEPLDLAAIERAIHEAGFTLRDVRARVNGIVTKDEERYLLSLPGDVGRSFFLFDPEAPDARRGVGPKLRERLASLAEEGAAVAVRGPIHAHEQGRAPIALGVETIEVIPEANGT